MRSRHPSFITSGTTISTCCVGNKWPSWAAAGGGCHSLGVRYRARISPCPSRIGRTFYYVVATVISRSVTYSINVGRGAWIFECFCVLVCVLIFIFFRELCWLRGEYVRLIVRVVVCLYLEFVLNAFLFVFLLYLCILSISHLVYLSNYFGHFLINE